jgi:MtN3 and saliva related transmembrane protein
VPALSPPVIEALGSGAALLTTLCWVPQAVRTIRTRDTRALSLATQLGLNAGMALWLAYGWLIGSWPLILANAVSLALVFAILVMKLRHG